MASTICSHKGRGWGVARRLRAPCRPAWISAKGNGGYDGCERAAVGLPAVVSALLMREGGGGQEKGAADVGGNVVAELANCGKVKRNA